MIQYVRPESHLGRHHRVLQEATPVSTIMPSSALPARLAAWTARLGNITDEVQSLIHDRDTWHTISEIGAANPALVANPFVMGHFNTLYYRRALVSVRAMVDPNNYSDSLLTLLTDIAAHPGDLKTTDPAMQLAGASTIDPTKVFADIERLKTAAATTKKYVNKRIAHIDRKGTPTVPTAPEIDTAVELIGELLQKYTLLLTGGGLRLGILVTFDWTSVFTVPWIDPAGR
jgi:hypothetical protein